MNRQIDYSGIGKLAGRVLMSGIFFASGIGKFKDSQSNLDYMAAKGLPRSRLLLRLAGVAEVGLGVGIVSGLVSRPSAVGLGLYLVPTTYFFHDFWQLEGTERQTQLIHFMKNLAIVGGLIEIASLKNQPYSGRRLIELAQERLSERRRAA